MWLRRLATLLGAALAAGAAGCGLGSGEERPGGVELRVTRDFGQERLFATRKPRLRAGETVMRYLRSERRVETTYGGKFVQAIDGIEGEGPSGRRDWFYYVNGIEASVGAADRALHPGDVVQWDYRRWDGAMGVGAIVGAFPEPFLHGSSGKRLPVRVECERESGPGCAETRERLGRAGIAASAAKLGAAAGAKVLRVVVGRWAAVQRVKAAAALALGPERSGVFARFAGRGPRARLELLGPGGRSARLAPRDTGLLAATRTPGQQPVWLVTGLDERGVAAAARSLDRRTLRDAFAVAATPAGPVRLPVLGGAR